MNCPRCQTPLGPTTRFCPNCGFSLDARGGKGFGVGILVGVASLGLAIAALALSGVLRLQGNDNAIKAPTVQAAPIEAPKQKGRDGMPDDIRDWLEHLRRTEEKRMSLARSQITNLMVSMEEIKGAELGNQLSDILGGDPMEGEREAPSVSKARDIAANVRSEWKSLNTEFESKVPPEACHTIAADFGQALSETGATVGDIIDIINNLGTDPHGAVNRLREIMDANKKMIDEPAIRADKGVQAICDQYGETKWFSIKGDVGGGGMFAMPSIPSVGGGF